MNQLQIDALNELFEYRRKVKIALAMKAHPLQQMIWSLFTDLELVKLMWWPVSHLKGEMEYIEYEINAALQAIDLGFEYKVLEQ